MKKNTVKILAVLMALFCILALTSCFFKEKTPSPETDLNAAKENLESKGYFVAIDTDDRRKSDQYTVQPPIGVEEVLYAYEYEALLDKINSNPPSSWYDEDNDYMFGVWNDYDLDDLLDKLEEEYPDHYEYYVHNLFKRYGVKPVLTITNYKDKDLADYEYNSYKLKDDKQNDVEEAMAKDFKYYKITDKYDEKIREQNYQHAKYMLENYAKELDKDENKTQKQQYESIVENYEKDDTEIFGKDGTVFWVGTAKAIEDSKK